jgi:hypothetical protein
VRKAINDHLTIGVIDAQPSAYRGGRQETVNQDLSKRTLS